MTRSSRTTRRIAAPLAAALVGGTFATLGLAAPAQAASKTLSGTFTYVCDVSAGGLPLGNHKIGVKAVTKVPASVEKGQTISKRSVAITLTMPELLRQSTVGLLNGIAADGASVDSSITLTSGGKTQTVHIPRLAAPKTAIPQEENAPWTIPASGTVPAIKVPANAGRSVTVGMPAAFTIDATIYKEDGTTVPSDLTCTGPSARTLGTIGVNYKPTAKKKITVSTKKGKAKKIKLAALKAKDRDGDSLRYSLAKKPKKKAGTAKIKGKKIVFKPKKKFTGKATFVVKVADGHGGVAKTKVTVKVKKKKK